MARIGCIALPETGHLNPLIALGAELARRGHEVILVNPPDAERLARAAGLGFRAVAAAAFPPGTFVACNRELSALSGVRASLGSSRWSTRYADGVLEDAPAVLSALGADLLVIDQIDLATHAVAAHLGVPFVTVCCCLLMNEDAHQPVWNVEPAPDPPALTPGNRRWRAFVRHLLDPYVERAQRFRERAGLGRVASLGDFWSPLAQISQQPEGLEFPRELPPHFHFAGPFANPAAREPVPFPWERLDGRPLVYAAFGSQVNGDLQRAVAIAEACRRLDAQLVLSFGGAAPPDALSSLPGTPVVVAYAPQLELLGRARAMVTHAGLNSVLECLMRGVPMVAIPITNDEPAIAARLARAGVGVVVPPEACDVARLEAALAAVVFGDDVREATACLQRDIGPGGLGRAGDIIDEVLATGRPVLRESAA